MSETLTFILSKTVWTLAAPANLLTVLLVLGAAGLLSGAAAARTGGRWLVAVAATGFLVCGVLPVGHWLAAPLENRFPRSALPEHADGIIVLGGAVNPVLAASRDEPSVNQAAERLLAFADLARRYPDATLLVTGGSAALWNDTHREDAVAARVLSQAGIDPHRILFERDSRNTRENALHGHRIAGPREGQTWILVTSAAHMPRAVGIFRRIGWPVLPWPVDYRSYAGAQPWPGLDVAEGLSALNGAVREWVGLAVYRALDRTDSLFPGP
ncbi:YdcF family protein [Azospirillum halopraeferens]|uniref:YdcF family protein n=1 Tax=Azospirillum halopraeferens TaxID=34010 RepID=UPI00042319E4|nr:YdcF family protein [Azospirillum halopraeferens]